MQNNNEKKVVELNIGDVLPNRFQPRIKFDEDSINELAMSIKKYGVIQPIVVRQIGEKYEIIAGERRYKASVIAGKNTIPAIVYELSDKESVEIALLENVQREDLTPIEKAISYKKILDMGYINQEELAEKIGKSQSSIANTLRLLNLTEEVQEALLETKISERHARSLLKIKNDNQQVEMLNKIINERLTVRKTDEEIEKMLNNVTEDNNVVNIPDVAEPITTNFDLPGFMNIDKIENEAQDIIKEEKPLADMSSLLTPSEISNNVQATDESTDDSNVDILKPGKFFNLFDDDKENKEMEELLSGNTSNFEVPSAIPVMPEFNFDAPAVEPVAPVMPEFNFEVPAVEPAAPAMPEFNFEVPAVEPVAPAMPEFNFEVPAVEPAAPAMPEFNFEVPAVESAAPAMPEFNFEAPAVEPVAPAMPEFNFEVPAVEPAAPAMPEFNFDAPAVEPVAPVMPEFNFEAPTVEPVAPVMPEFNFDAPAVEPVAPVMPEFNFDAPAVEPVAPVMPEFNFDAPAVEPVAPVMPEFNFDVPAVEPVASVMPEFNFDAPAVEPVAPVMPEFNFDAPAVEPAAPAMPEFNFDAPAVEPVAPVMPEFNFDAPAVEPVAPVMPEFNFEAPTVEPVAPVMPEFNFEIPMGNEPLSFATDTEESNGSEGGMNFNVNNLMVEDTVLTSPMPANIRLAIDTIRNCQTNLQNMGFVVNIDESDLENIYQVTFKINK